MLPARQARGVFESHAPVDREETSNLLDKNRRHGQPSIVLALLLALTASALASGCATRPDPQTDPEGYAFYEETNDPLEPWNRGVFAFNKGADKMILTPLGIFYRDIVPPIMQTGIDNMLDNLASPVTFLNDLLQGNMDRAGVTLSRLVINTTLGIGGMMDPASEMGLHSHHEDFGQTLAVWGVGEGPYLMLPLLGPSNPRDAVGRAVDSLVLDPFGFLGALVFDETTFVTVVSYTRTGLGAMSARAKALEPLDELERSSLDLYAAIRSAYRQNRQYEIEQGPRNLRPRPTGTYNDNAPER